MGTWVVVRPWNCGQTVGRNTIGEIWYWPRSLWKARRGDTIRDKETWQSLTLMSLPPRSSNYPYFLCKNLSIQTALVWSNHYTKPLLPTVYLHWSTLVSWEGGLLFPFLSCLTFPYKQPGGRERTYYSLKAVSISIHLSKNYIFCQFILSARSSACSGSLPWCQIRREFVQEYTAGYPHFITLVPVWLRASTVRVNRVNTDRPCRC